MYNFEKLNLQINLISIFDPHNHPNKPDERPKKLKIRSAASPRADNRPP
jgi:hypothetical protein